MEKLKKIVELLNGKGSILVRDAVHDSYFRWFVNCHWNWSSAIQSEVTGPEREGKVIFKNYVDDLDMALDEIIEKLEVRNNGNLL